MTRVHGRTRRILVALLALGTFASVAAGTRAGEAIVPRGVTWSVRTMGTYANVTLVTADSTASAPNALAAFAVLRRVDSLMSNWTTTSEVARINREGGRVPIVVQPEVATVLDASLRLWRETGGAYDITVEPLVRLWGFLGGPKRVPADSEIAAVLPRVGAGRLRFDAARRTLAFGADGMRIDLGGIAKGYAVEAAAESLAARGVRDALVDVSGNMHALGRPAGGGAWRIGIRDPRGRLPYFARLSLSDRSISTSGQYEQFVAANGHTYGHILDPRTGMPVSGLISVTVVAASAFETDAWDTPLFVLGVEAAKRTAHAHDTFDAVLVAPGDGIDTVWVETSLRDRFALVPEAESRFVVRWF
jgi:thiamine biosynthesis lipoprotein